MAEQPIISEVQAPQELVEAIASAAPQGGGVPIDRIPFNPQLAALEAQGTYTKRIAATDRCIRTVVVPVRGGESVKAHCSRACVGVGDQRLCPDHDKQAFKPNQTPTGQTLRVFNSASIPLSSSERAELEKTSKSFTAPVAATPVSDPGQYAKSAVAYSADSSITVSFTLEELELPANELNNAIISRICDALDGLPATSIKAMKRVVAIQERLGGK